MFDNDKIMNSHATITIYIDTETHICTNIHNIIHSYTIQIRKSVGRRTLLKVYSDDNRQRGTAEQSNATLVERYCRLHITAALCVPA